MKVCWFGTYECEYPRNRIAIDGLKRHDAEVVECHEEVTGLGPLGARGRLSVASLVGLAFEYAWASLRLSARHARIRDYDVMVVGFRGHLDVVLARLLTWFRHRPLVLDPVVSVYSTLVEDRRLFASGSLRARLVDRLETWIYRLPDLIVADTEAHRRYFQVRFAVPEERLAKVLTGADERVFSPVPRERRTGGAGPFQVLYCGRNLPLHGVETILGASKLLHDEDVSFTFIGRGEFSSAVRAVYGARRTSEVPHLTLIDWVPYEELPKFMAAADICLGIFGGTLEADLVMPNKAYQAFAMGKPLVTGRSRAADEVLGFDPCAVLVPMRDPVALAEAIRMLRDDPQLRARLGVRARERFLSTMSLNRIGGEWHELLHDLVLRHGGPSIPAPHGFVLAPEVPVRVQRVFGQAREKTL